MKAISVRDELGSGLAKAKCVFVLGTDTGVGKTRASGVIARAWARDGVTDVAALKAVASGCYRLPDGSWGNEDAEALAMASTPQGSEWLVRNGGYPGTPLLAFERAMAPWSAATLEGRVIRPAALADRIGTLALSAERAGVKLLLEGIGGALVPLSTRTTFADMIEPLRIPVVVVGRTALGAVNHMLLTLDALSARDISPIAIVLSQTEAKRDALVEAAAVAEIAPRVPIGASFLLMRHGSTKLVPLPSDARPRAISQIAKVYFT